MLAERKVHVKTSDLTTRYCHVSLSARSATGIISTVSSPIVRTRNPELHSWINYCSKIGSNDDNSCSEGGGDQGKGRDCIRFSGSWRQARLRSVPLLGPSASRKSYGVFFGMFSPVALRDTQILLRDCPKDMEAQPSITRLAEAATSSDQDHSHEGSNEKGRPRLLCILRHPTPLFLPRHTKEG